MVDGGGRAPVAPGAVVNSSHMNTLGAALAGYDGVSAAGSMKEVKSLPDDVFWAEIGSWFADGSEGSSGGSNSDSNSPSTSISGGDSTGSGSGSDPFVPMSIHNSNGKRQHDDSEHGSAVGGQSMMPAGMGTMSAGDSPYSGLSHSNSQTYICSHPKLRVAMRWLSKLQTDPVPLANPMTPEVAQELLQEQEYVPGARPRIFRVEDDQWIFKENLGHRTAVYGQQQDRWHNSGGIKGARDLPSDNPVIRRRYGSLIPPGSSSRKTSGEAFRYHEYSLLSRDEKGNCVESGTARLFHVTPKRPTSRRGPGGAAAKGSRQRAQQAPSQAQQHAQQQAQHQVQQRQTPPNEPLFQYGGGAAQAATGTAMAQIKSDLLADSPAAPRTCLFSIPLHIGEPAR